MDAHRLLTELESRQCPVEDLRAEASPGVYALFLATLGALPMNLRVAVFALAEPAQMETDIIARACPPLNLTGWDNPDRPTIKAARKACADDAREQRPR